jgi:hypothetical protein
MARARNIKPGFFKNYDLADLGPLAQLLFAGLWCLADKEGRLEDKPRLIKAEVFPYYEVDVNGELTKLERLGFVKRYKAKGVSVISIDNFKKHQSPHHTERASELPDENESIIAEPSPVRTPEIHGEVTVNPPLEDGGNPSDSLIPDSLIACENQEANASVDSGAAAPSADLLGDREGNGEVTGERGIKGVPACPVQQIVDLYHTHMPTNPKVRVLDDSRKKAIRARWNQAAVLEGVGPFGYKTGSEGLAAWKRFFEVCAASDFLIGNAKPQPGKPPFVATIDFLMSPSGFKNAVENKYHREVKE